MSESLEGLKFIQLRKIALSEGITLSSGMTEQDIRRAIEKQRKAKEGKTTPVQKSKKDIAKKAAPAEKPSEAKAPPKERETPKPEPSGKEAPSPFEARVTHLELRNGEHVAAIKELKSALSANATKIANIENLLVLLAKEVGFEIPKNYFSDNATLVSVSSPPAPSTPAKDSKKGAKKEPSHVPPPPPPSADDDDDGDDDSDDDSADDGEELVLNADAVTKILKSGTNDEVKNLIESLNKTPEGKSDPIKVGSRDKNVAAVKEFLAKHAELVIDDSADENAPPAKTGEKEPEDADDDDESEEDDEASDDDDESEGDDSEYDFSPSPSWCRVGAKVEVKTGTDSKNVDMWERAVVTKIVEPDEENSAEGYVNLTFDDGEIAEDVPFASLREVPRRAISR